MPSHCQLTGAKPSFGKSVSHSHKRTSRRWNPNIQKKTYFVPSLGRNVTLHLSTRGMRTVDKIGIEAAYQRVLAMEEAARTGKAGKNGKKPVRRKGVAK